MWKGDALRKESTMQVLGFLPRVAAIAFFFMAVPVAAPAQMSVGVSVDFGPPAIPVYEQPACPQANDIWAPGYWAYGDLGYYWVPGTWVAAPESGYLWTPGYWGYNSGSYGWNQGYWATQVGFYGGVNYGAGYYGSGYSGGRWSGNNFQYNTAVSVVNTTSIRNVYRSTVVYRGGSRTSYNGGPGGITARPSASETAVGHLHHVAMLPAQRTNEATAAQNRAYLAKVNGGKPATAAVARPLTATNRPAGFSAITASDRKTLAAAPKAMSKPEAAPKAMSKPEAVQKPKTAPAKPVEMAHPAAAPKAAPQHQAAPQHMAPVPHQAAPQQHQAAPQHMAPAPHQAAPQHQQAAPQHQQAAPQHQQAAPEHQEEGKPPH